MHLLVTEDDSGRLPAGRNASVSGTIRSGRTESQTSELASRLGAALADRAAVDPDTIDVTTRDIEASYTMEGGALLPEPGSPEEAAWKLIGSTDTP